MKNILGFTKNIIALSPMDGITDAPYRYITKTYGNPDIMFTEFTHVMGLCYAGHKTLDHFMYQEIERPVIAQIYGAEPGYFYHAAKIVASLGYDAVDINMGCPAKTVASSGAGASLIKTPDLASEIIYEVKRGVSDWVRDRKLTGLKSKPKRRLSLMIEEYKDRINSDDILKVIKLLHTNGTNAPKGLLNLLDERHSTLLYGILNDDNYIEYKPIVEDIIKNLGNKYEIPTSVKTRIGYDAPITEKWITHLSKSNPDWISVHGRTLKQMYTGKSDWNELRKAVHSTDLPILTNGDVDTYEKVSEMLDTTGSFGVLIGKGSMGNPWVFNKENDLLFNPIYQNSTEDVKNTKIKVMLEHAKLFKQFFPEDRTFVAMRKHFGWYIKGFDSSKDLRIQLMRVSSLEELQQVTNSAH